MKDRDPKLHEELQERLSRRVQTEAVMLEGVGAEAPAAPAVGIFLETIVREGASGAADPRPRSSLPEAADRVSRTTPYAC